MATMNYKLQLSKGKDNCNFVSSAITISNRVRSNLREDNVARLIEDVQSKAKEHGGIDKVQIYTNEISGKVLFVMQRFSQDEIARKNEEYGLNQPEVEGYQIRNEMLIVFADEFFSALKQETWPGELGGFYAKKIFDSITKK